MANMFDEVRRINESEKILNSFVPSKELQEFHKRHDRYLERGKKEFETWGGQEPKLWYRMFYSIANKIHPHKPSEREFLYLRHWMIGGAVTQ